MTIAVTLTLLACSLFLSLLVDQLVPVSNIALFAASTFATFLIDLLLGTLVSGEAYLYMNIVYDREASFGDLKQGFAEHPEKAMLLRIPFAAAATLASSPMVFYQIFYRNTPDRSVLFYCMLLSAAGLAIEVILELVYSQVFYLLHDFPERRTTELFSASARLMRGHIGQYALLLLSYLPWLFLSALLFFIPALFVVSQINAVQAAFYRSLTSKPGDSPVRYRPTSHLR